MADNQGLQTPSLELDEGMKEGAVPEVLKTNRRKAIIAIIFNAMAEFVYGVLVKISVNEKHIKALDLCLVRSLIMFVGSLILVLTMRVSLRIEPKDRCLLVMRSFFGIAGNIIIVYGFTMVPLTVTMTIINTQPIWASILGWLLLRERMSRLEIVALILCFGCVLCIAFSKSDSTEIDE